MNTRTAGSRRSQRDVAGFYPYSSLRQLNATKRHAGLVVSKAIQSGELKQKPCEVCHLRRAEAHHDDYAKPLDVKWLCRFHHRKRDADLRDQRREQIRKDALNALPVAYLKARAKLQPVPFARFQKSRTSFVSRPDSYRFVREVTLAISDAMNSAALNESQIAKRLRVSRQVVNMQFAGGFRSLKCIAAYAAAMGLEPVFSLRTKQTEEVAS